MRVEVQQYDDAEGTLPLKAEPADNLQGFEVKVQISEEGGGEGRGLR